MLATKGLRAGGVIDQSRLKFAVICIAVWVFSSAMKCGGSWILESWVLGLVVGGAELRRS